MPTPRNITEIIANAIIIHTNLQLLDDNGTPKPPREQSDYGLGLIQLVADNGSVFVVTVQTHAEARTHNLVR